MILESLYETQIKVDQVIQEKLRGINIHDVEHVDDRVLAWKVEVGEFANEEGSFKYWKHSHQMDRAKTIEELADCMAFLLSVGLSRKYHKFIKDLNPHEWNKVPKKVLFGYLMANDLASSGRWRAAFEQIVCIGLKLGFSVTEMEVAYFRKSDINIDRQERGY